MCGFVPGLVAVVVIMAGAGYPDEGARSALDSDHERGASLLVAGGEDPIIGLIKSKKTYPLEEALAKGADPNTRDQNGTPALVLAVELGNAGAIDALRHAGADLRAARKDGKTALAIALEKKDYKLASLMLPRLFPVPKKPSEQDLRAFLTRQRGFVSGFGVDYEPESPWDAAASGMAFTKKCGADKRCALREKSPIPGEEGMQAKWWLKGATLRAKGTYGGRFDVTVPGITLAGDALITKSDVTVCPQAGVEVGTYPCARSFLPVQLRPGNADRALFEKVKVKLALFYYNPIQMFGGLAIIEGTAPKNPREVTEVWYTKGNKDVAEKVARHLSSLIGNVQAKEWTWGGPYSVIVIVGAKKG